MTKIIVGLGNPGVEYEESRHNVGFKVIDALSERWQVTLNKKKFKAIIGVTDQFARKKEGPIYLAKPMTYMNRSGDAIRSLVNFYKIDLGRLFVIYDDYNLPLSTIRIRRRGSSGGHKGLESIIDFLQTDSFPRLRLGIGRPEDEDPTGYVLEGFKENEKKQVEDMIMRACEAVEILLEKGIHVAMNKYNKKVK